MRARRGWLLLVPATVPTAVVLGTALVTAGLQSTGLMPLVGRPDLTLDAYRRVAADAAVAEGLLVTLSIAVASTALATLVGVGAAVTVLGTRVGGRLLRGAAALTVPFPHVVGAAAIGLLLSDSGLVARLVGAEPGTFPPLVAGPWWVAVVLEYAWKESAFIALVVVAAVGPQESELKEAAAVLGASPWQAVRRVTLPLAAPATVASAGISFAYVVGSYEVAWLLGRISPEPLPVLAYRLYTDIDLTLREDAMAVALVTTAVAVTALLVSLAVLRRTAMVRGARR